MAVIEYLEGAHPAGFIGIRVATTLGSSSEYRQAYFSYSDYSPRRAKELADALNEQWREQAFSQRQEDWLNRPNARAGQGWLATGLRADLLREYKIRRGERRMYYAPAFIADKWPRRGEGSHRCFRVNVSTGRSLEQAFRTAVSHYASVRQLGIQAQAALLSRQPAPQLFVKLAIMLGMKGYTIDINAIRQKVGVPEL
ncbi:hypothetical protein [Billgrantia desiderata]|uniref:hypothetical protein n=1 Tax=Billgrantia desiderata TaxID=52021 RepID=UPI00089E5D6D|nr:hypothetical protein [Halomonas desiderata]SEG30691.1 hypothetical protein SAMN04487953_12262 [Halomonas desiderata]